MQFSKLLLFSVLIFSAVSLKAQTPVELHITHMMGGINPYVKNQETTNDLGSKFTMTRVEYYLSKISITHDGGMVTDVPNHYILANGDVAVKDELGSFNITSIESISFYVGVDTPINNADPTLQPAGHPLAPKSPSMHWGWASGYRFAAIEGKAGEGFVDVFEVHSLGNDHYYKTTVSTTAVLRDGKLIIPLYADYTQALRGIDVKPNFIDHGVPATDVKVLNNFKDHVFKAGNPVSISNTTVNTTEVSIFPNPVTNGSFSVQFNNGMHAEITITDIQGKEIIKAEKSSTANRTNIDINTPGLYFVNTTFEDGSQSINKLLVQ